MRFSRASVRLSEALDRTIAERDEVIDALVYTHQYVGWQTLPPAPGWSWFDALSKCAPEYVADVERRAAFREETRHDTSQHVPGRTIKPCDVGPDGKCQTGDHYWTSGVAAGDGVPQ